MTQTSSGFNPLKRLLLITTLFLILVDSGACLSCWHCIAENCDGDPAGSSRASQKQCAEGQTCQKVYFEMFSKLDHRQYESTVRGCSSNCVQRDDFPSNCSTLLRESRGCIKRTCCQDYDLCNSVTRTSVLTELLLIMFVCLVVNYWCV